MRQINIEQTAGQNLRRVIARELVKSPIVAVKELVSNSYDADAQQVVVDADELNQTLLVRDDGSGMDEGNLEGFLRMGDSIKIGKPKTSKGRACIGQFGIAQSLLGYLGDAYDLETWKDGRHIIGAEDFSRDTGLEYEVEECSKKDHGTKILVRGVKTLGTSVFSLKKLARALTWEVPNKDDIPKGDHFDIILNGEKLERKNIEPKKTFTFEETLPNAGQVSMSLNYFTRCPTASGVYVYVNGRSVGDSSSFDIAKVSRALPNRIFAQVVANGLKQHISFNREFFREDEAFGELQNWVYSCLRRVKRELESERPTEPIQKPTDETLRQAINETKLLIQVPGVSQTPRQGYEIKSPKSRAKTNPISFTGLHTVDEGPSHPQARFDLRTNELLINTSHPFYSSPEINDPELMKANVLLGSCFGLAEGIHRQQGGDTRYERAFNDLCSKLFSTSFQKSQEATEEAEFISSKKYAPFEAADRLKMSLTILRKLIDVGVLPSDGENIRGDELNKYLEKSFGYTPACQVMEEYANERGVTRERRRQLAEKIDERLPPFKTIIPFLFDIGVKQPFFLVPTEHVSLFKGLYAQKALTPHGSKCRTEEQAITIHLEKYGVIIEQAVREAGLSKTPEFISLDTLCNVSRSDPPEIFRVIGFAQKRGLSMPTRFSQGQTSYSMAHFRKAKEQYLQTIR